MSITEAQTQDMGSVPPPPAPVVTADGKSKSKKKPRLNPPADGFPGIPEEWSSAKYAPMRKTDFKSELHYWLWQLDLHDKRGKQISEQIEIIEKWGDDPEARKKAKKHKDAVGMLEMLMASGGISPEEIAGILDKSPEFKEHADSIRAKAALSE